MSIAGDPASRRRIERLEVLAGQRGPKALSAVLTQQVETLNALIEAARQNLAATSATLAQATAALEALETDQTNLAGRVTTAESDIAALQATVTAMSATLTATSNNLVALEAAVSGIQADAAAVTIAAITSSDAAGDPPTDVEFNALRADVVALHASLTALKAAVD
jgi:chromosome segregation ATPase